MHYIVKLQNNKGSEIKFSENQSPWKVPVSTRCQRIEYLLD